jgi:hypothetical protein
LVIGERAHDRARTHARAAVAVACAVGVAAAAAVGAAPDAAAGGHADTAADPDPGPRTSAAAAGRLAADAGFEITPRSQWARDGDGTVQRFLGPYMTPSKLVIALRAYSDARLRYFRKLRVLRRLESEKAARDAQIEAEVAREAQLLPATVLWSAAVKPSV